ncbi:helix-turn-helix domain-containing protein [Epidermidibacterium keratini]|uniref:Helix-turn-helix domain-containing protein n=1 Tax=Epidermidibacterium keratini TaxID=1891644 RepID=A0A7L4YNI8_9ACTN|nr:helix-turn-helix domain-containing protein [Epidermidibacterium keratini]QHC00851.1 helix-turn-helix domain-containing protein [Epidermidibacterium keratini]
MSTTPLDGHELVRTRDRDQVVSAVTKLITTHSMTVRPGGVFDAEINFVALSPSASDKAGLGFFAYGTAVEIHSDPSEVYAVNVPVRGRSAVEYAGRSFSATPHTAAILSTDGQTRMRWDRDYAVLTMTLGRDLMQRHLERLLGRPVARAPEFRPDVDLVSDSAGLVAHVRQIAQLERRMSGATIPATITGQLLSSVMTSMLVGQPHSYSDLLLQPDESASRRTVRAAIELMHDRVADDLTVIDIADLLHVGERSLQAAFRQELNTTPSRYLRGLRLDRVRELLQRPGTTASVSQIAADVGFYHHGRFAAAYRARFGEPPSQTVRDARPERSP